MKKLGISPTGKVENGRSGFLVDSFDDLVDKLKLLHENQEVRYKIGEYGHKRGVTQFTWDKIYDDYINAFKIPKR